MAYNYLLHINKLPHMRTFIALAAVATMAAGYKKTTETTDLIKFNHALDNEATFKAF